MFHHTTNLRWLQKARVSSVSLNGSLYGFRNCIYLRRDKSLKTESTAKFLHTLLTCSVPLPPPLSIVFPPRQDEVSTLDRCFFSTNATSNSYSESARPRWSAYTYRFTLYSLANAGIQATLEARRPTTCRKAPPISGSVCNGKNVGGFITKLVFILCEAYYVLMWKSSTDFYCYN